MKNTKPFSKEKDYVVISVTAPFLQEKDWVVFFYEKTQSPFCTKIQSITDTINFNSDKTFNSLFRKPFQIVGYASM